jgi:hypothetical protein
MITVLLGLEVHIKESALGIGGEKGGAFLSRHIEVFVGLSTFSKFLLQHVLFRRVADAGDTAGVYRNSTCMLSWMRMNLRGSGRKLRLSSERAEVVDSAESRRTLTIVMRPPRLSETGGKGQVRAEPSME